MSSLTLHLKREYFEAIRSGAKRYEYRLCTPYWRKRLEGKNFDSVHLLCGYPARGDADKRLEVRFLGCREAVISHPHFGDQPVQVFEISLGRTGSRKAND